MPDQISVPVGGFKERRIKEAEHLRTLAAWYREFAEKTANPVIGESRIATAEELEQRALEIERHCRRVEETAGC